MDPNETLKQLRIALTYPVTDIEEAMALFDGLDTWLSNGGFLPDDWDTAASQWD